MMDPRERAPRPHAAVATERTAADLHASRQLLQLVLDNIPAWVFWKDPQSRYVGCNLAVAQALGLVSTAAIAGLTDDDLPWREKAELFRAADRAVAASGQPLLRMDEDVQLPDGQHRWFRTNKFPLVDVAGQVIGVLGTAEDITERREAEDARRHTESILRGFFDSRSQMRGIVELVGNDILHVMDNEAAAQFFGRTPDAMRGRLAREMGVPDATVCLWVDRYRESQATGAPVQFDYPHPAGEGRWLAVSVAYVGAGAEGRPRFAYVVDDHTERRRVEEQLRQAQKMEAVGRLAAGVAHDFNNLLGVITGYGELAVQRLAPTDPLRMKVGEILKASDRAAALTRQLLGFARLQTVQEVVLPANGIVSGIERMLRSVIREDIAFHIRLQPDAGHVRADQRQMERVLLNLVVNARDAMPDGGRIDIETANVELDVQAARCLDLPPGPYVTLAVRDTGTGIAPEIRAHIFEPFFTTKEPGKGTGLGLASVFGTVKQSGGGIDVDSSVGAGMRFIIYLPRVEAPRASNAVSAAAADIPRGSETVLLVEDESALKTIVHEALEELGYNVLAASSGIDALELSGRHAAAVRVLVTDLVMPGMSGRRLAREIRRRHPGVAVLFVSGYDPETIGSQGAPSDGEVLQKPFTTEALARAIRRAVGAAERSS